MTSIWQRLIGVDDPETRPSGSNGTKGLVAAGRRVDLSSTAELKMVLARQQRWQREAWEYYDVIGEVKRGVNLLANVVSRARLFVAMREPGDDPRDDPSPDDDGAVQAVMDPLRGATGTHAEVLARIAQSFQVAGECWLGGLVDGDGNPVWEVKSIDEVALVEGVAVGVRSTPSEKPRKLRTEPDRRTGEPTQIEALSRLWLQHARFSGLADAGMRGVLSPCEEVLISERAFRASLRTAILNGLLLLPSGLSFGPKDPTHTEGPDGPDSDEFIDELMRAGLEPITDEGSPAAVFPLPLQGHESLLEQVRHVPIPRGVGLDQIRDQLEFDLRRIVRGGLNLPPEMVFGLGESNHWGAGQIEASFWREHAEPLLAQVVGALTTAYLRPQLIENLGMDPGEAARRFVWGDVSGLLLVPGRSDASHDLHRALVISDSAYRRANRYTDEDAPSPEERAQRVAEGVEQGRTRGGTESDASARPVRRAGLTGASAVPVGDRLLAVDREAWSSLQLLAETTDDSRVLEAAAGEVLVEASKRAAGLAGAPGSVRSRLESQSVEAAGWLAARLHEGPPLPQEDEQGERGPGRVPAGVIRETLARAGGAAGPDSPGLRSAGFLEGVALFGLGLAAGWTILSALTSQGRPPQRMRWDYGPGLRLSPFAPHTFLDGIEVESTEDERLRSVAGWPATFMYPGDHIGCICMWTLLIPEGQ